MIDTPFELLNSRANQTPLPWGGVGGGFEGGAGGGFLFCTILAAGEQPEHDIPVQLLQEAPYIVCCDGAIQWCDWADAVVGDGDSIPSWARDEYECIFHQEDEQDDNDLTKATRFCISKGFHKVVYLGATGKREDHTLGNISLLMRYAREFGIEPLMATNYGWFVPVVGRAPSALSALSSPSSPSALSSPSSPSSPSALSAPSAPSSPSPLPTRFSSFPGQQVSLFNFSCTHLRTEGLRYEGYPFQSWWQGTLNEATAESFTIEADGDYLVYRTYEAK